MPYNHYNTSHVVKGNIPMMNWTERNRGAARNDSTGGNNRRQSGGRGRGSGKKGPRDTTKPKVICQLACFVPGHEAVMCWTLARALLAHDFFKKVVDRNLLIQVQNNYKKQFQPPENPRANRMCAESLWTYCSHHYSDSILRTPQIAMTHRLVPTAIGTSTPWLTH